MVTINDEKKELLKQVFWDMNQLSSFTSTVPGEGDDDEDTTTLHIIFCQTLSTTGDSVWQKFCSTDTLPIRQVENQGQKPKYHVENDYPGIISRGDFQRVQKLIAARKEQFYRGPKPSDSIYIGHIFCGHCGCVCRRKVTRGVVHWVCDRRNDGKR